jgi:hypothetical protein
LGSRNFFVGRFSRQRVSASHVRRSRKAGDGQDGTLRQKRAFRHPLAQRSRANDPPKQCTLQYGELKLDVWVAKDGYTKVIWEGDLEHLRKEFRPVTFQEAKNLATARMQSYAKDENYDLSLFKGPESITPPISIAYEFDWTYRDKEGDVKLYISVEEHGSTILSYDGDLQRLRKPRN